MNVDIVAFDSAHHLGENAAHPRVRPTAVSRFKGVLQRSRRAWRDLMRDMRHAQSTIREWFWRRHYGLDFKKY